MATSCLLGCFKLLRYHCFPLQLILNWGSLRPSQALPIDCRVLLSFPILLTVPCVLSLVDHCYIRHASLPPKAYRRRKGDSSIDYHYTKRRAGRVCAWVSFMPRP